MEISKWLDDASPRNCCLLNRGPSARWSTFMSHWPVRPRRSSKQYRLLRVFLVPLQHQMIRSYCLRSYTVLVARSAETKLELSWKSLSCWVAFIVSEATMQAPGETMHQWSNPVMNPINYSANLPGKMCLPVQNWDHFYGVTNNAQIEFEAFSTKGTCMVQ